MTKIRPPNVEVTPTSNALNYANIITEFYTLTPPKKWENQDEDHLHSTLKFHAVESAFNYYLLTRQPWLFDYYWFETNRITWDNWDNYFTKIRKK